MMNASAQASNFECTLPPWSLYTLYKVIMQTMLLYASETWAFPKHQMHRLNVFQVKCLRNLFQPHQADQMLDSQASGGWFDWPCWPFCIPVTT